MHWQGRSGGWWRDGPVTSSTRGGGGGRHPPPCAAVLAGCSESIVGAQGSMCAGFRASRSEWRESERDRDDDASRLASTRSLALTDRARQTGPGLYRATSTRTDTPHSSRKLQPSHPAPSSSSGSPNEPMSSSPSPPQHQMPVARPDAKVKLTCVGDGGVGKVCRPLSFRPLLRVRSLGDRGGPSRPVRSADCVCPAQTCLLIVYSQKRFPTVRQLPLQPNEAVVRQLALLRPEHQDADAFFEPRTTSRPSSRTSASILLIPRRAKPPR